MNLGAVLKSFIYVVSSSLLYPVLALLVLLTLYMLTCAGSFLAEGLDRARRRRTRPGPQGGTSFAEESPAVRAYVSRLRELLQAEEDLREVRVESLLQDHILSLRPSLDRVRLVIRVGPSLGLMGTLIPMGTGLAALGQGDMARLSTDLVIAFTTTVVGLAQGTLAYCIYTVRARWAEEDAKEMELATEILTHSPGAREEADALPVEKPKAVSV
ncbi:MotA/TolQ/ExbB proton channel family protein [Deferrisoma camini]|uniref:MotA/TolQ/ExbB proton channel family protein n=1 Tax=Deferrisoma camini TaxID=1035120 RepID=UPI00046D564F|nr:MotA/TolQ/ExbB proton channel family protein [Deferrisoma camini]